MTPLADQVAARMRLLSLTVGQVAERAGLSRTTVSDILNNRRPHLSVATKGKLESALGWRIGSVDAIESGGQPGEAETTAEVVALLTGASARQRALMLDLMRVVARYTLR
jgi:transcriptional regulator with XRE-family HTH domain